MSKSVKIEMLAPLLSLLLLLPAVTLGQTSTSSAKYRQALERWHFALGPSDYWPSGLSFVPYFGYEHSSFGDLNNAVKELSSLGANMIPFMIEQIRRDLQAAKSAIPIPPDKNYESAAKQNSVYDRLDKDVELMFMLGGIQIRAGMTDPATAPLVGMKTPPAGSLRVLSTARWLQQIEGFLKEWDSGVFERLEPKLHAIREKSREEKNPSTVDYRETFPYRLYGVYGLPFLIKEIRITNSAECFNAFLIITFHRDLYVSHYENPQQFYPTISDKMSFIQSWWNQNKNKLSELGGLPKKIEINLK